MTERGQLEQAIAALEAQRAVLGDAVVDAALGSMRQQLAALELAEREPASALEGERKLVTIMFADISGFTALAETMDPEAVRDLINACFDHLVPVIEKYEGTVDKFVGDAIVALFGAPVAHENDPERALRAALEMRDALAAFNLEVPGTWEVPGTLDLRLHFGINTGLVIAGGIGSEGRQEYSVMGDAANVASRLEEVSEQGEILVGPDTYRLAAPLFEFETLEPVQVKGKAEPVPIYRLLTSRAVSGKVRGVIGLESPLVGREAELTALREAVERLRAGVGGIVTIVGEAGIGKSRLVAELRGGAVTAPLQWVEGRCLSYGTSIAYLLWLDALRSMLGVSVESPTVEVRDALRQWVQTLCPDYFDDVYPYLGRLMALPLEEKEDTVTLQNMEGDALKMGTFHAVETLIECAANDAPLIIVCEDLHWADPTSLELLEQLLAPTDRAPLLFICVFRPETEHGSWRIKEIAARRYRHRHTDLWLDRLSAGESEALVDNLLHEDSIPQELKERILSHAEGNPFYVEEIIRSLVDSGAIVQEVGRGSLTEPAGRWQATQTVADIPIPDTLQGVVVARIDRLPEEAKRILQMAAVIGRIFLYRVLATIAEEGRDLDAHLLTLQREEMIRERARAPELEYIFKHHLTREAAYNGLLKKERRVLHRRVAETMEKLFPHRIEEQVELLAHHWEQAGEQEKAINYLLQAGDRARRLGASLEAVDFYQLALQKAPEGTAELRHIHEGLGDVYLINLSRHDEALEHYKSFLALAESEEDLARGARKVADVYMLRGDLARAQKHYEAALARLSSLPPLAEASRIHCGLAYLLMSGNRLDDAVQYARASLEISGQISDVRGLADANRVMGVIASHRRDLEVACEYDERSLALYRELGDLARTAQTCNNVGDSYRLLGQMDRALEYITEGLELARRIGDTRDEALLLLTMAELFLDQGQWETAVAHLEQALPLAEESGAASRIIQAHQLLGSAYQGVGQLADAECHLKTAEALSRDTQHLRFAAGICLDLGRLNATQGDFDEALKYIELALDAAGPEPSDAFLGLMHRCYGDLHGYRNNWDDAAAHLEESLMFLERAKLPAEVGKTRLGLGAAYASRGEEDDRGRACEQLLAALLIFRQIAARGYVSEVEARLRQLGC